VSTAQEASDEALESSPGPRVRHRGPTWLFALARPRSAFALPFVALLLFGAPLYMGGALAPAVPLWACVACTALVFTGVDWRALRADPWVHCAALVLAVSVLQLLPWPGFLLRFFDPTSATISAGALAPLREDRGGAFRAFHLDPGNGYALLQFFVGVTAAYLASRRLAHRGHAELLHAAAAYATLVLSVVTLAHWFWGLEKVYSVYVPRIAPPLLSPLLNPNHLAAFSGAGLILWLGRAASSEQAATRVGNAVGALLCGAVCALTLSRGGVAAALAGVLVFLVTLAWLRRASKRRSSKQFFRSALVSAAVVTVSAWVALEQLRAEYATGDVSKLRFFGAIARSLRAHWMLGVGPGAASVAVATTEALPGDVTAEWAENLPLELALAFGIPVALAVLWLGAKALWSLRPSPRSAQPVSLAAFCALCSLVLHDFADFSLWLAAGGYLAAVLAGVLSGEQALRVEVLGTKPHAPHRWVPAIALAVGLLAAGTTVRSPLYVARERLHAAHGEGLPAGGLRSELLRHPADAFLPLSAGAIALKEGRPDALRFFNRALALAPGWAQPHVVLAEVFFRRGLRAQALGEVRQAASLSSQYHGHLAGMVLGQNPTDEDVVRAIPEGARGVLLLRELARRTRNDALSEVIDGQLRARVPGDLDVLLREAARAQRRGETAAALVLLESAVRRTPDAPSAYLALADLRGAQGDVAGAERTVRAGLERQPRDLRLAMGLARWLARRGDVQAMRAAVQQVFEIAGADVDRRIETYGLLGSLELELRNEADALSAFERADAMAYPAHPYLSQVLTIVHRMGDLRRLRDVCSTLSDAEQLTPAQRILCADADRRAPPVAL